MKRYIKASKEKPVLDNITVEWKELDDESGIEFIIYSDDGDVIFEELFDYNDVDSDAIYDSAVDMAILSLSQKYELTENAVDKILGKSK